MSLLFDQHRLVLIAWVTNIYWQIHNFSVFMEFYFESVTMAKNKIGRVVATRVFRALKIDSSERKSYLRRQTKILMVVTPMLRYGFET